MPTPAPTKPGDPPPAPDDDEHGGELAKLFRDLEKDELGDPPALEPEQQVARQTVLIPLRTAAANSDGVFERHLL
jgi:hypothetical protein